MRTSTSIIVTLLSVALLCFFIYKISTLTAGYIIGFAIALGLAWAGGYLLKGKTADGNTNIMDALHNMKAEWDHRFQKLMDEYNRGRATVVEVAEAK